MSYYDEDFYRQCAKEHMWASSSTSDENSSSDSEVERLKPPPIPLRQLEERMVSVSPNGTITRPGKFQIKSRQKENESKVNILETTVDCKQKNKRQQKKQKNRVAKSTSPNQKCAKQRVDPEYNFRNESQNSGVFTNSNNLCEIGTFSSNGISYGPYGTVSNSDLAPISTISNKVSSQNINWVPSNRQNFTNQSTITSNDLLSIDADVLKFNSLQSENAILKPVEFTQSATKPTTNVHRGIDNLVDSMRRMEVKTDQPKRIGNESKHKAPITFVMPSNNARIKDNSALTNRTRSKDFGMNNDISTISAFVSSREANRNAVTIGNHYRNGSGQLKCNLKARDNNQCTEQTRDLSTGFSSLKTNETDNRLMGTGSIGCVLTDSVEEEQFESSLTPNSFNSYSIIASETESQRHNNNGTVRNDEPFDSCWWKCCCCCPCIIM